jgi:hypothetical protein
MIHWHLPDTSSRANAIGHLMAKTGFVEAERYGYEIYLPPREQHYGQYRLSYTDTTKDKTDRQL